jgi:phospholipid/cholesterol/gamma-HCH transport system substrate-binding protein
MSDRRLQIQVGILFILSVILLVLGILWFKEFKIHGASYEVTVEFPNTSGLSVGDQVEVKGVPSGKVDDIRFEENQALVTLQLDRGVVLYADARIAIENMGIMGQKVVTIQPGSVRAGKVAEGTLFRGEYLGGIPELMGGVGSALDTFEHLATRIDTLLAGFDTEKREQTGRTLDNMERATKELADLLSENRGELSASIKSMNAAMTDLHQILDGRSVQFGEILDGTSAAAGRLDSTLTRLDSTVTRMDRILARVEDGQGTLGKAIEDRELYDQLTATLADAKALLKDVREHPKRYFKFSIF